MALRLCLCLNCVCVCVCVCVCLCVSGVCVCMSMWASILLTWLNTCMFLDVCWSTQILSSHPPKIKKKKKKTIKTKKLQTTTEKFDLTQILFRWLFFISSFIFILFFLQLQWCHTIKEYGVVYFTFILFSFLESQYHRSALSQNSLRQAVCLHYWKDTLLQRMYWK